MKTFEEFSSEKIRILYLHGLGSSRKESEILKHDRVEIVAHDIDYSDPLIFKKMLDERVDGVIGHSIGGLIAYYVSNVKKIPSLLFNPAFDDPDAEHIEITNEAAKAEICDEMIAVVGLLDDEIPAETQLDHLDRMKSSCFVELMGHDVPDDIKIKYFNMFVSKFYTENT